MFPNFSFTLLLITVRRHSAITFKSFPASLILILWIFYFSKILIQNHAIRKCKKLNIDFYDILNYSPEVYQFFFAKRGRMINLQNKLSRKAVCKKILCYILNLFSHVRMFSRCIASIDHFIFAVSVINIYTTIWNTIQNMNYVIFVGCKSIYIVD